tara:strand:+ start:860 stop:1033 length:174 start_codon:yes stop_codon:yes gene_type:complete
MLQEAFNTIKDLAQTQGAISFLVGQLESLDQSNLTYKQKEIIEKISETLNITDEDLI